MGDEFPEGDEDRYILFFIFTIMRLESRRVKRHFNCPQD